MQSTEGLSKLGAAESLVRDGLDAFAFLEQVVHLVPGILYIYNHALQRNEFSNVSIAALLGFSPDEIQAMGENVLPSLIHADDLPRLDVYFASLEHLADGETASIDYRAVARDGTIVWLRSNDAVFERTPEGGLLRHIGISNDVTEEVTKTNRLEKAHQALQERTELLEQTYTELEELTYIATHDLKGPLANIGQLVQMLKEDLAPLEQESAEMLDLIERSNQQASAKLKALTSVALVRSAELPAPVLVDLAEAARKAVDVLAFELREGAATVDLDFDDAPQIYFPPFEISSILENLLSNALKYAHPERRAEIKLFSRQQAGGVDVHPGQWHRHQPASG